MPQMYGIPNCSTVKKARDWLASHGVAYTFHDYRKQGVPADRLQQWVDTLGWEKLVNRQGLTWRKLPDARKAQIVDRDSAILLMQEQPSIIKRPVLELGDQLLVGFDPAVYGAIVSVA